MLENKKNIGIVVYIIYFLLTIVLTIQSDLSGWPDYLKTWLWVQCGILAYLTFSKRISVKIQSYTLTVFSMIAIFLTSVYRLNFSVTVIFLIGCSAFLSIYSDGILELIQCGLSLIIVLIHFFVLRTIVFTSVGPTFELISSIAIVLATSVYLYYSIQMQGKTEKELKKIADKATEAERSKSDFLANMSHEIRTPMNAIIGMCELTLREPELKDNVREYCHNIQNSGRSLLSIINDVLDVSKIDSGKMEIINEEFNIASTLNDVINMTVTRIGDKPLELLVDVDPDIPKSLVGDEIRIRQVIINLMTNAVKYTHEGIISLNVSMTKRDYGINLMVSVKDTGIGISPKNLKKLFTSFQQVDTKKNRSVEGTGLGLAISKRLVTKMGGFINVSSEYGRGSEFKFVIPLKVADSEAFVCVNKKDEVNAVYYEDENKIREIIRTDYLSYIENVGKRLDINYSLVTSFEQFVELYNTEKITHCFTGKKEYLGNKDFFDKIACEVNVVVIQNRTDTTPVDQKIKCIFKPCYALPLASVVNNENIFSHTEKEKMVGNSFVAPKARVLIVDDNNVNLQVAVGLMQPYHMQVLTADSGVEAIRMLKSKDYDLVFMDHMMPGVDGIEATQIIRKMDDEYFKKLPIVALTANAVGNAKEMFMKNGFDGFVAKPIELSTLDRVLKRLLPDELKEKKNKIKNIKSNLEENARDIIVPFECQDLINVDNGLTYTGNNVESYLTILRVYMEKGKEKLNMFRDLFQNEDWKNYIIEAHALKSSSLSIGAGELSELAKKIELSGKAGNIQVIFDKHLSMLELYEKVIYAAEKLLLANELDNTEDVSEDVADEGELKEFSKEEFESVLEGLKNAADTFDSDEMLAIVEHVKKHKYMGRALEKDFNIVSDYINDFEYEDACKTAFGIKQKIEGGL